VRERERGRERMGGRERGSKLIGAVSLVRIET